MIHEIHAKNANASGDSYKRFEELQGSIDKVLKALSMREPSGWQPRKAPPLPPPSR